MANIFKTTLKKDVIADIANNNKREVRFPITKFWANRFTDEYNLDERTFVFKSFDSLEFSSPSNKETGGETYSFDFDSIFVDGDEFVLVFKDNEDSDEEICVNIDVQNVDLENIIENEESSITTVELDETPIEDNVVTVTENYSVTTVELDETPIEDNDNSFKEIDENAVYIDETIEVLSHISDEDVLGLLTQLFEDENVLNDFYMDENVFATNAKQIIVLPKGRILGFKKSLPVNNDAEVRIEFDMNKKIYFDSNLNFDVFEDEILNMLTEIRKNNFVFIWKRYTGIFKDNKGIYFGIKYSTRKSIGFDRKYNIQ